ncbi:hypothetical protein BKA70DRAFT_1448186 [Coprinopsis sp. MPI-PUGE-AT-0042]|nr:hypothetical protein BKA70DRAFT_1448186 [Coprinopsis sp. MPI-PUGE-AT-0042]
MDSPLFKALVCELSIGNLSAALDRAVEVESKHGCIVLLFAVLPFLSLSALPRNRSPHFDTTLRRGLLVIEVLSKALTPLRTSPLRFEAATLVRDHWEGLVSWTRLLVALNRSRDICVTFFIQVLLLNDATLEREDIMGSEATIRLVLSLLTVREAQSGSTANLRMHTSSIFLSFIFFNNNHALIQIHKKLRKYPQRIAALTTALSFQLRDTVDWAGAHALPPVKAISTATQCFAIAHGLLADSSKKSTVRKMLDMAREIVRTVAEILGQESSPSELLLATVVDFLRFLVRWTTSEAFHDDPILPIAFTIEGGALSLLITVLTQMPEGCEAHGTALTILAILTPYILYRPVLLLASGELSSPIETIIASLPLGSATGHALICLEDIICRSKVSSDKETAEAMRSRYCDNLDLMVPHMTTSKNFRPNQGHAVDVNPFVTAPVSVKEVTGASIGMSAAADNVKEPKRQAWISRTGKFPLVHYMAALNDVFEGLRPDGSKRGMAILDMRASAPLIATSPILGFLDDFDIPPHICPRLEAYGYRAQQDPSLHLTLGIFVHGNRSLYILALAFRRGLVGATSYVI